MTIIPWYHCKYSSSPVIAQLLYKEWRKSPLTNIDHFIVEFNDRYQVKIQFDRTTDNVELDISPEQMILLELTYTV